MAINLNPKADGALISAAYRAASGNTPANYSRTLERAADSYDKTMEAQGETWSNFAKLGAKIGGEMMENANLLSDYAARGAGLNPENAEMFMEELYANRDAQRELGLFGGRFGDRETRKKRAELKIEQQELMAEIDAAAASIKTGSEAVAAGNYDATLNEKEAEMVNAIIKSNLKDNVTGEGNVARLSRDEETGSLIYTLYKENGEQAVLNGEPVTMTIKEFNRSIATNVNDNGVMQGLLNKVNDSRATAGRRSLNGVYDPQMKQMDLNELDNMLQTPTDLRRAFKTKFGYSNTSFFDDIQNPSTLSADLYSTLLKATGGNEELALGGITEGIEDTDNSGGISQAELANATNYGILSANILGMKDPEVSKAYFKEYTSKKFEDAYKYGYSKKPPTPGSGGTDTETDGFVSLGGGAGKQNYVGSNTTQGDVPNSALNFIGKSANDRADIDLGKDKYIWDEKNGVYTLDGIPINNKSELFTVIYGENFDPSKIIGMYNSIKDWQGETRQAETFDDKTNLDVNFVNKADQTVAAELNGIIPSPGDSRNPNAYIFKPKAGQKHPRAGAQAWFRTKGKTTKSNADNLAEMIDLLQTFGLYDSIGKQLP